MNGKGNQSFSLKEAVGSLCVLVTSASFNTKFRAKVRLLTTPGSLPEQPNREDVCLQTLFLSFKCAKR